MPPTQSTNTFLEFHFPPIEIMSNIVRKQYFIQRAVSRPVHWSVSLSTDDDHIFRVKKTVNKVLKWYCMYNVFKYSSKVVSINMNPRLSYTLRILIEAPEILVLCVACKLSL